MQKLVVDGKDVYYDENAWKDGREELFYRGNTDDLEDTIQIPVIKEFDLEDTLVDFKMEFDDEEE